MVQKGTWEYMVLSIIFMRSVLKTNFLGKRGRGDDEACFVLFS